MLSAGIVHTQLGQGFIHASFMTLLHSAYYTYDYEEVG